MKVFRTFFLLLLMGGFFFLLYRFVPWGRSPNETGAVPSRTEEDARMEGLQYKEWQDGVLTWVLDADAAKYFHERGLASFEDADVTFLPPAEERILLHADKVLYDVHARLLTAEGNVSGESEKGFRFFTRTVSYRADEKEVSTADKVTLEKDRLIIEGVGMEGSLREQRFVLLSSVRALFSPAGLDPSTDKNRPPTDVRSGRSNDQG